MFLACAQALKGIGSLIKSVVWSVPWCYDATLIYLKALLNRALKHRVMKIIKSHEDRRQKPIESATNALQKYECMLKESSVPVC